MVFSYESEQAEAETLYDDDEASDERSSLSNYATLLKKAYDTAFQGSNG
jgi:hypothetical protein